jgi:hypothetical protein
VFKGAYQDCLCLVIKIMCVCVLMFASDFRRGNIAT